MKHLIQIANKRSSPRSHWTAWVDSRIVCAAGLALTAMAGWAAIVRYVVLHQFPIGEGANISAPLVLGTDGNFYGTAFGGPTGVGDIFKITPSGAFTLLHAFPAGGGLSGGPAYGPLLLAKDGNFYGFGSDNVANVGMGIFKITPGGDFTILHIFKGPDGVYPNGRLVQNGDGLLYGTGGAGGPDGGGTFYSLTTSGDFKVLHAFPASGDDNGPGSITAGKDGNFYGFESRGIFKITPSGDFTLLHRFTPGEGANVYGAPVQGPDGAFYGTASYGGPIVSPYTSAGTAFKFTPTGQFTLLHSFRSGSYDGEYPLGGLVLGRDGNFYGTTTGGGFGGGGTIYKMTPAGVVTVLHSFNRNYGERAPKAGLTVGPNGDLYGTTSSTEVPSMSVFFRLALGGAGDMEADDTQVPALIGPGNGTGANVAGGILTYLDSQTHKVVKYKVQRPAFAAAMGGTQTQGMWIWVADDGQHGSTIAIDAAGNVTATQMPLQMIHTLLGPGR